MLAMPPAALAAKMAVPMSVIGDVYGVEIYVTTNLPAVEDAGAAADQKLALFFQRDALLLVEQLGLRTQSQYKQEWLADLVSIPGE
jgi:hypothetical protein